MGGTKTADSEKDSSLGSMGSESEDELSFLDDLERGKADSVRTLIHSDEISNDEKLSALKVLLSGRQFELYKAYNAKETPERRLLKLLSRELRAPCSNLIETSNIKALRVILSGCSSRVSKALDELEKSIQEMSPDDIFLKLIPPEKRDMCRALLESKNFSAVKTILPQADQYVLSALADLERAWNEKQSSKEPIPSSSRSTKSSNFAPTYGGISREDGKKRETTKSTYSTATRPRLSQRFHTNRTNRRGMSELESTEDASDHSTDMQLGDDAESYKSESTLRQRSSRSYSTHKASGHSSKRRARIQDTFSLDSMTGQYLKQHGKKLTSIEDLYHVRIGTENIGGELEVTISAEDKDSFTEALSHLIKICTGQEFKCESVIQNISKVKLTDEDTMEIFKKFNCICSHEEDSIVIRSNNRRKIDSAKRYISTLSASDDDSFDDTIPRRRNNVCEESERRPGAQEGRSRAFGSGRDDKTSEVEPIIDNAYDEFEDLSRYPDVMNVLFLGETGVGKSTAINSLVNYLQFPTLDDAMNDFTVLIRAKFTITEDNGINIGSKEVETPPTVFIPGDENEVVVVGESATQHPKCYDFIWNVNGLRKTIRIIDTPGIGDVRGITKNKENFNNILKFIADFPEIHAICILIQPDAKKLTPAFRFCIDELLAHLHRTASRNLIFCFPSTRSTFYKPGETYTILQKHLGSLKRNRNIDIPLNSSTLFSFDNEAFKYLCGAKQGIRYSESQIKQFRESYAYSYKQARRLFAQIIKIPPHKVCETLSINNTRSLILALAAPLAEVLRNQTTLIQEKIDEITTLQDQGADLRGKLSVQQEVINPKEIDYPKTVCAAQGCVEYKSFNGNSPHVQTVYKTICHDHCYLQGIKPESYPDPGLRECWAMEGENCKFCGCSWQTHLHIRYELETKMINVTDPAVQKAIADKDDHVKAAQLFVDGLKDKMNALKRDSEKIMKYSAKFADFLNANSIIPYNDSYLQYIEYLITQEKAKSAVSQNDRLVKELEKHKSEYQAQIQILQSAKGSGGNAVSIAEVNHMIDELKGISTGEILQKMEDLELLSVRETQNHHIRNGIKNVGGYIANKVRSFF